MSLVVILAGGYHLLKLFLFFRVTRGTSDWWGQGFWFNSFNDKCKLEDHLFSVRNKKVIATIKGAITK